MALVEHLYRDAVVDPRGGLGWGAHRKYGLSLLYKHAEGQPPEGRQGLSCYSMEQYCNPKSPSGAWSLGISISKQKWALLHTGQLALSQVVLLCLLQAYRTLVAAEHCGGGWGCVTHGIVLSAHCCRNTCQPLAQRIQSCSEV